MKRFYEKVVLGEPFGSLGPCLIWDAHKDKKGYGKFWLNGTSVLAHRLSFFHANGEMPDGLEPDHLCRNTSCVAPNHLEAVTHQENIDRRVVTEKTHCKHGHEYTSKNTYRNRGKRWCKTCLKAMRSRQWQEKKRARQLRAPTRP